nr:uncharacterized protein LOC109158743 [Ipomoea batatas]
MLSSPTEKQVLIGDSAEEADLLRRSKKKTKRGLSEREDADMEIEEDGRSSQMPEVDSSAEIQKGQASRPAKGPTLSFKGALTGLGNKNSNFNKEGFKIWDNSRFGALQNLEDETEDEAQEENNPMDRPNGPTGALLSGRGKRPQTQTTEAQIMNDKSEPRKENNTVKKATSTIREEGRSAEGSKRQGNQAAETESHTVVRGYDKGNKVVRTMITEEGSTTEEVHTQPEGGDHHQDPPDLNSLGASDGPGDPMAGVKFAEGPTSSGLGVVLQ